ncbi:MAG: IclR family transcriptional regulator [Clostridia bacterium]|nr:IclR family transcriptional regulator [Clostridia bacterium]
MNTTKNPRQTSQSSIRLLHIIECLAENRTPMRLQDLAEKAGMTQSTVLRYLYSITESLNSQLSLRSITSPFMNKLVSRLSLGTCLVVGRDGECMYLDCIENQDFSSLQRIGKAAPMHATGSGKLLLSQYSDAELEEYIKAKGLPQYTDYTITDMETLKAVLAKVRENGYAMDEQECELGLRCVSFPLRDYTGSITAAISVFGDLKGMNDERLQNEIIPMVKDAAESISARLGYSK